MAQNDPKCRYCGAEMLDDSYAWFCPVCHSSSPVVIYEEKCQTMTEEEKKAYAKEAAFRRPPQKPLTLEELFPGDIERSPVVVWIEFKGERPFRVWTPRHSKDGYNKTWRCWLSKPTDEERKAAPWEE